MGWERGDNLKGPLSKLGQKTGGKQPTFEKGSLRREASSAMGKGKLVLEVSDAQPRGSVMKFGSKKLWTTLIPSSSRCRQGVRSRSKPLMHEKPSSNCEAPPKEDAFEAGTQMERRFSASPLAFYRSSRFRKRCSREGASSIRGDTDLRKSSNDEDRAGYKGLEGFVHRGSSITVFPSNPVIREKGLNFVGTYGMIAENLEVSSSSHSQSSLSFFPLPLAWHFHL